MTHDFDPVSARLQAPLERLEQERLRMKASGTKKGIILGAVMLGAGGIPLYLWAGWIGAAILAAVAVAAFFLSVNAKTAALNAHYKNEVIAALVDAASPGARYAPGEGIGEEVFNRSGLFGVRPDRYHTEDLIEGEINGTAFRFAEVHAEERRTSTDSKGRTRTYWVDIFRGFLFIADFGRPFRGATTVYRNSWIKLRFGTQRVKLESPEFEKRFDVYGDDPVEARYLLTPLLMERIVSLDRRFGQGMTLSFRRQEIIVAIADATDHFEASIWRPVTDRARLEREFRTLRSLCGIVEELKLKAKRPTGDPADDARERPAD